MEVNKTRGLDTSRFYLYWFNAYLSFLLEGGNGFAAPRSFLLPWAYAVFCPANGWENLKPNLSILLHLHRETDREGTALHGQ